MSLILPVRGRREPDMRQPLRIILAEPRGFCAGVVRAVDIVERALRLYGAPVYVRHEIVHNNHVVDELRAKGAVFVEDLADVPPGSVTVFSAHGVSDSVEEEARARDLDVIDAICPLVQRVHLEARRYAARGYQVILIGHAGHPEVEGVRGRVPGGILVVASREEAMTVAVADPSRVAYVTQTTLSVTDTRDIVAALAARFPGIQGPDTSAICYATQNRQNAVQRLAEHVDLILVIGAANSSNSNRLKETALAAGVPAHLVGSAGDLRPEWFAGVASVGITAGASAPETLVQGVVRVLHAWRDGSVETLPGPAELVSFRLPARLADASRGRSAPVLRSAE